MTSISRKFIILVLISSFYASISKANDFLDGIDDFENGRFREAASKLVPLANQGDLYAQTYVTWIREKDKTLIPDEALSFPALGHPLFLQRLQDTLDASIVKLRYTGLASPFGIPHNKKRGCKDLGVLLTRSNPKTLIVMNDLIRMNEEVPPSPKKATLSVGSYYGEAVRAGDYVGALKLRELRVLSQIAEEILRIVEGSGENPFQSTIYFSLYNHFKERAECHDLSRNFCRMAAYHGHGEAQFTLLNGYISSQEEGNFWVEQAASHRHKKAIGQLAYIHEQKGDLKRAFELYLKADEDGDADFTVLFNIGAFYENGRAGIFDLEKALEYLKRAYAKTSPSKDHEITDPGVFHAIINILSKIGNPEALAWLKAGVAQKDKTSMREYGISLFKGTFEPQDPGKALVYLRLAGLDDDPYSESKVVLSSLLIEYYLTGTKSEWDAIERFLLKKATPPKQKASPSKPAIPAASVLQPDGNDDIALGLPILKMDADGANYLLSILYHKGKGGAESPSYEKASFHLEQAMNFNHPLAFYRKGNLYEIGPEKNDVRAFECYLRAYELGFLDVVNNLGVYYMNRGEDNALQNDADAVAYFRQAMELDQDGRKYHGVTHHNYAKLLYDSRGGLVFDEVQWISLMEKSVSLGDTTALRVLGLYYLKKDDFVHARECLSEAATRGDKISSYNLALLDIQTLPNTQERLEPLDNLETLIMGDLDPEILFNTGLMFVLNRHLREDLSEKGIRYLEKAFNYGSTEARCLLDLLNHEQALRNYDELRKRLSRSLTEAARSKQAEIDSQVLEETLRGIPLEFMGEAPIGEEEEQYVENEVQETVDYITYAAQKKERPKRAAEASLDEKDLKKKYLSRKTQTILDLLNPKLTRQVSVHKVFSIMSDLIKEKGGSIKPSKKGVSITIGDEQLFMHLQHGQSHESKLSGGRLEAVRALIKNVTDDDAVGAI